MIILTYSVYKIDKPFLNGVLSFTERGIQVELAVDVEAAPVNLAYGDDFFIPNRRIATLSATLHTMEERTVFGAWIEKENFRFALKGLPALIPQSETSYLVI